MSVTTRDVSGSGKALISLLPEGDVSVTVSRPDSEVVTECVNVPLAVIDPASPCSPRLWVIVPFATNSLSAAARLR